MQKWDVELAKMFKERENPNPIGMIVGVVITGLPDISVSIGDDIILDKEQLLVANRLYNMHTHQQGSTSYQYGTDTFYTPVPVTLTKGDKVILQPATNEQVFFVLDKVGE